MSACITSLHNSSRHCLGFLQCIQLSVIWWHARRVMACAPRPQSRREDDRGPACRSEDPCVHALGASAVALPGSNQHAGFNSAPPLHIASCVRDEEGVRSVRRWMGAVSAVASPPPAAALAQLRSNSLARLLRNSRQSWHGFLPCLRPCGCWRRRPTPPLALPLRHLRCCFSIHRCGRAY